jgi:hypothetical protein
MSPKRQQRSGNFLPSCSIFGFFAEIFRSAQASQYARDIAKIFSFSGIERVPSARCPNLVSFWLEG